MGEVVHYGHLSCRRLQHVHGSAGSLSGLLPAGLGQGAVGSREEGSLQVLQPEALQQNPHRVQHQTAGGVTKEPGRGSSGRQPQGSRGLGIRPQHPARCGSGHGAALRTGGHDLQGRALLGQLPAGEPS